MWYVLGFVGAYAGGVIFNLMSGGIRARAFQKLHRPIPGWYTLSVVYTAWLSWLLPVLELIARRKERQERAGKR